MVPLYVLHTLSLVGLIILGINMALTAVIYMRYAKDYPPPPDDPEPDKWPTVLIQLPVYNERTVVERLLQAVAAIDYPRHKLTVQVLDDSDDDTVSLTAAAVERARAKGLNITHVRREERTGYKAGALAYGLTLSDAQFVAIFDADFVPPPDFLRKAVPPFMADPELGIVQARWSPLNEDENLLTRALSLTIDQHFVVEQIAQDRAKMMTNFTGSAGVWRRAAIDDAGGWRAETLSEDLDLSYRARMRGWEFLYLPDVLVPSEYPNTIMALKRQQARWSTGTTQCLLLLGPPILKSELPIGLKLHGIMRMSLYFVHPLMLLYALTAVPLMSAGYLERAAFPVVLGVALLGIPAQMLLAQLRYGGTRWQRLIYFPVYLLMGFGIMVNNTLAMLQIFSPEGKVFKRTPKFDLEDEDSRKEYAIAADHTTILELVMMVYCGVGAVIAAQQAPLMLPLMVTLTLSFAYVAFSAIFQGPDMGPGSRKRGPIWEATGPKP